MPDKRRIHLVEKIKDLLQEGRSCRGDCWGLEDCLYLALLAKNEEEVK
jgi:hypothetical protein